MEISFTKVWLAGAGVLVGAITGAAIWGQRAAAIANKAAEAAGEDGLITAAAKVGTSSLAATIQGAMVGGFVGLIAVAAYMYFSDPDRGFHEKHIENDDHLQ